jgi:tripartite-type tricarboxylate transporter receptor subunit TctC
MSKCPCRFIVALASALLGAFSGIAAAADYPVRPVRMIVPYATGGNADIIARLLALKLGESLGQQVVVDNKPGANGIIGTDLAAKAPADGHTIVFVANTHVVNPSMVKQLPFDTLRDLAPITRVNAAPLFLTVAPGLPVSSVKELVALAKAKPGTLNYGSTGNGSPAHLAGVLLDSMAGISTVHVPYQSGMQAVTDTMSGQVQLGYPSVTSVLSHVRAGKLKALAITGTRRSPLAPDMPTVAESGLPGYEAGVWTGILAPAGTPRPIIARLNADIVRILDSSEVKERLAGMGSDVTPSTPEEFQAYIEAEISKWAKVIRAAGIEAK